MEHMTFDPDGDLFLLFPRRPEDRDAAEVDPSECMSAQSATEEHRLAILEGSIRSDAVADYNNNLCQVSIRMLVSSRHMMLASRVFKVMLSNTFSEGLALRSTGQLELPLPDDDPVAFEILLNIIHGHPRSVPRQIDLLLLSRLAMVVDKYELQEVMVVFSDTWIDQLENTLPKSFTADLPPWLFISWVFDKPSIFSYVTKILQLESTGRLGEDELASFPIPRSIIDTLETCRQKAICEALSVIDRTIAEYQKPNIHCPRPDGKAFECDAMILGALIKSSKKIGIWPPPDSPYDSTSFGELVSSIRQMKIPTFCDEKAPEHRTSMYTYDSDSDQYEYGTKDIVCAGVKEIVEASMRSLEDGLRGLDPESFQRKSIGR